MSNLDEHVALLEKSGFTKAAEVAKENAKRAGKLARAYEHYRYVSQESIEAFQDKLYEETKKRTGKAGVDEYVTYDALVFDSVEEYPGIPPADVLGVVSTARSSGVFDDYEVAYVKSVRVYNDPIIFGRIKGCSDRFFIAQWGDDVKLTDLIGAHEG